METEEFERRLIVLERSVEEIKARLDAPSSSIPWWIEQAGRFANDPTYDEIVRLGAAYRRSLRPDGEIPETHLS